MKVYFLVLFITVLSQVHAKPFLRNTVQSLAASFSQKEQGNIADFRKLKSSRLEEDDGFDKSPEFDDDPIEPTNQNEAQPGIIQKKIAKLLRKIQLISQIASRFYPNKNNNNNSGSDDADLDFNDSDFDSTEMSESETTTAKINDDTSETEKEEVSATSRSQNGVKYELSPAGVGIYFMELFGSVVGLLYGAALQVSNTAQPTV